MKILESVFKKKHKLKKEYTKNIKNKVETRKYLPNLTMQVVM